MKFANKGIDYIDTFGSQIFSYLENDILATLSKEKSEESLYIIFCKTHICYRKFNEKL